MQRKKIIMQRLQLHIDNSTWFSLKRGYAEGGACMLRK